MVAIGSGDYSCYTQIVVDTKLILHEDVVILLVAVFSRFGEDIFIN